MTQTQLEKLTAQELADKQKITRAVIDLDGGDIQSRRVLLRINKEIGRRNREYFFRKLPLVPRL